MTGLVAVAVYCVVVVVVVLAVLFAADAGLRSVDRREAARRARSVFGEPATWVPDIHVDEFAGGVNDPADDGTLDAEYDLELHVADALRVANEDDPR